MRQAWILVAAIAFGGCQCSREKAATPTPEAIASVTPSGSSEPVFSALRHAKQGTCDWVKLDPIAKTETILASVDRMCDEMNVSWSHDEKRALLWVPLSYANDRPAPARAWEVTIGTVVAKPLDLPQGIEDLGFDASGSILALVAEELEENEIQSGKIVRDGKTYTIEEGAEGLPILVHAQKRDGSTWKTIETKLSDTGWDLATGIDALDASRVLGPRSATMLFTRGNSDLAKEIEDEKLAAKLKAAVPFEDEEFAYWAEAKTPHGAIYFLEECFEVACAFRRLAFPSGDGFAAAPGFAFNDQEPFEAFVLGPWLLGVTPDGANAHLWDLRTKQLSWRDKEGAYLALVPWP